MSPVTPSAGVPQHGQVDDQRTFTFGHGPIGVNSSAGSPNAVDICSTLSCSLLPSALHPDLIAETLSLDLPLRPLYRSTAD